jgi:hypothetical protein
VKSETITVRRISAPLAALYPAVLMPCDDASAKLVAQIPSEDDVQIRIVRERSLPQHKLFWSVLDHVAKNSKWEDPERLLVALKVRLGRYDLCKLPNGQTVPVPHSISFAKMDQADFQSFMDRAMQVICEDILGGYDSERLIREARGLVPG